MQHPIRTSGTRRVALALVAFTSGIAVGAVGIATAAGPDASTTTSTSSTTTTTQVTTTTRPMGAAPSRRANAATYLDCSMPNPGDSALAMSVSNVSDLGYTSPFWPAGSVRVDELEVDYETKFSRPIEQRDLTIHPSARELAISVHVSNDGVDGPITTPNLLGLNRFSDRGNVSISTPRCSRNGVDGTTWELAMTGVLIQVTNRSLNGNGNDYVIRLNPRRLQFRYTTVTAGAWDKPLTAWFGESPSWNPGKVGVPATPPPCEGDGSPNRSALGLSIGQLAPTSLSSSAWPAGTLAVTDAKLGYDFDVATFATGPPTSTNGLPLYSPGDWNIPAVDFNFVDPLGVLNLVKLNLTRFNAQVAYPTCTYGGVAKSSASYRIVQANVSKVEVHYDGFSFSYSGQLVAERLSGSATKPTGTGAWGPTTSFG